MGYEDMCVCVCVCVCVGVCVCGWVKVFSLSSPLPLSTVLSLSLFFIFISLHLSLSLWHMLHAYPSGPPHKLTTNTDLHGIAVDDLAIESLRKRDGQLGLPHTRAPQHNNHHHRSRVSQKGKWSPRM